MRLSYAADFSTSSKSRRCPSEFESQFVYAINDRIKDFFSEEVLRALPLESMWRFVFAVPPRKRIASQCTLGEFLRGDTILGGGAGRRIMGTQGLTCGGGYQSRHNCEMDSRRSEIPKCCTSQLISKQPAESDQSRLSSS